MRGADKFVRARHHGFPERCPALPRASQRRRSVGVAVGRSAAEIDAAIRAARSDARHSRKMLNVSMLREHLNIDPSTEDLSVLWRVAVHEAGHAIIGAALELGSINSMQITCDGGVISRSPVPNHGLLSDIEAEIAYAMGGRAAERIFLGEASSGAGGWHLSDLAKATRYAIEIETTFGLGHEGLVWHEKPNQVHLSTPAIRDRVRQRLTRAEQRAGKIVSQCGDAHKALAQELLKRRSLNAAEIEPFLRAVTRAANESCVTANPTEVLP